MVAHVCEGEADSGMVDIAAEIRNVGPCRVVAVSCDSDFLCFPEIGRKEGQSDIFDGLIIPQSK
jgi:hypothetical protein